MEIKTPFIPDLYYHIYNHANGDDNLFRQEENYYYFLQKYNQYLSPILETFAYCLMPNHFHFLIKIKSVEHLVEYYKLEEDKYFLETLHLQGLQNLEGVKFLKNDSANAFLNKKISQTFSNFFNAYAKAYNNMYNRKGAVFRTNIKRKVIDSESYFTKLIHYIHSNPLHHGFTTKIEDWTFSSYPAILLNKPTQLQKQKVIDWFGGLEKLIVFHKEGTFYLDKTWEEKF